MVQNENIYQSVLNQLQQIPLDLFPDIHNYLEGIIQKKETEKYQKQSKFLEEIKSYFQQKPIEKAWLFGSYARNEATFKSDIDLLVRFVQPNDIDLFDYIGMKQDLEDITGLKIDLVEEGQELESIKPNIEKDKILIYER